MDILEGNRVGGVELVSKIHCTGDDPLMTPAQRRVCALAVLLFAGFVSYAAGANVFFELLVAYVVFELVFWIAFLFFEWRDQ